MLRWVRRDGSVFWTEQNNTPILNDGGELIALEGIARDITERKEAEAALREAQARYQLLTELTFEGIVLHHNGVVFDANPAFLRMFDYELAEIVGQQVIGLIFAPESHATVRENVHAQHAKPYEAIAVRKDGHRFPVETVCVDEVLVSRILLNLLANAIKYSPSDSEVRLELDMPVGSVVLRVIDQGGGIHPDDLDHIFDPFYRARSARTLPGTGLGLSIVKSCVARHRGRITVDSQVGAGSTFIVELPAQQAHVCSTESIGAACPASVITGKAGNEGRKGHRDKRPSQIGRADDEVGDNRAQQRDCH